MLTVAFVYGVLFALDRRRKAHGWLALQAATASSYCLFGAGTAEDIFGHYDAVVMLVLMVIAIYGSIQFTRAQFKLPPANRAWVVLLLVALLAAAGFSGPFAASDVTGPVAVSIIALGVGSQIWTLFPLALRADAPTNARVMLLAWIMLAVINGPDLMAWGGIWDPLGGFRAGSIGIACFGLLQAVVLMRDFMASLRRADRLNEVLQGKIENLAQQTSTVAHLNEELGRQVLARSEQLSDALMRLATAQGEPALLKEHEIVEGRYDVVRVVGSGGMGVVYEVRRLSDGARLAMKILSGAVGVREMARFAREAKLAATVHHENVVRIFDVAVSRVGFLFLVLEFVDGAPLSRTRERYGNVGWVLRVLHGVARGLEAIHAEDIVHRDLKPANVLVRHDASGMPVDVKITDFGISNSSATSSGTAPAQTSSTPPPPHQGARSGDDGYRPAEDESRTMDLPASAPSAPDREPGPLTQTGTVLGTPLYMAPELLRDPPSAATPSDIYSFGVLAFELVHGRRPFSEPEAMGRAFGYFHAELPPMEPRGVPAPLAALFTAALALNPRARPTAAALVTALSRALVDSQPPVARGPFATDKAT